jgi:dTDP-glucose 4,6-dehydratase
MILLVTGGSGFIGSNFIRYISKTYPEYSIINLDLLTYAVNQKNIEELDRLPNYTFFKGDICDSNLVAPLVCACDAVIHFAAESHVDRSITGPGAFIRTNVVGTQVLLDACVKYKKRFHHISTDECYGSLGLSDARFTESSPYDPSSPYSASKASSDHLVRAYHRTYGLETTISNCSNNYGNWQNEEKLIPHMIRKAMDEKRLPIYGTGENIRDWVHVEDHCAAIDLILHSGRIGKTYLIGGNAERSNLNVVKQILNIMGRSESMIDFVTDRKGHDLRYAVDSSKIERELGWTRQYSFEDGLKKTVSWYLQHALV